MPDVLNFISNNNIASGLIAAIVFTTFCSLWKWLKDRKDSKKIYEFIVDSRTGTDFTFRSTEFISSHTKIPEDRVAELCSKHPKIKRNEQAKQSWQVII